MQILLATSAKVLDSVLTPDCQSLDLGLEFERCHYSVVHVLHEQMANASKKFSGELQLK